MKPYIHAVNSANKFGGKPEDYLPIHNEMDSSKAHVPDVRHRCVFHSSFGIYIIERIFGVNITNSDGKLVSVRDIAEQHVLEDLDRIPTLQDWLNEMKQKEWMVRPEILKVEKHKTILDDLIEQNPKIAEKPIQPIEEVIKTIPKRRHSGGFFDNGRSKVLD